MSTAETPLLDLNKAYQINFAANLDDGAPRKSEYLQTNFEEIKKVREVYIDEQDYDTSAGHTKPNYLEDYYAGLRANDDRSESELKEGNFVKKNFRENIQIFILHILLLFLALTCGSSVGIFYYYIQPTNQLLKASWRMLFLAVCISPFALYEYKKGKYNYAFSREALWDSVMWKKILLASIGYTIWTVALLIAVNHTSIAQANLLIGVHPLILLGFKHFRKMNLLSYEIVGSVLVVFGVLLVFFDGNIDSFNSNVDLNTVDSWTRNISGNLVALIGSIGGAIYFTKNHEIKSEYPFFLGILLMSVLGFIEISFISMLFEGTTISFDPNTGMFGFLTGDWIGVYILTIIITGFGAWIGYLVSFRYFESFLLLILPHFEPVFAVLLVATLGWQSLPGLFTVLAFLLVIPGVILLSLGIKEGEIRQYDILEDNNYGYVTGTFSNLVVKIEPEEPLLEKKPVTKHKKKPSIVTPVSWEK